MGTTCGIIHRYNSMVFDGSRKKRKICSPLFDSRKAGNLRFYFALGRCSQGISLKNIRSYMCAHVLLNFQMS